MNFNNSSTLSNDHVIYRNKNVSSMNHGFDNSYHDLVGDSCKHDHVISFGSNNINSDDNDCNLNQSNVTSLLWINVTTNSLLAVGSDDGCVRIWRDVGDFKMGEDHHYSENSHSPSLASSFHALPDLVQSKRGPGLLMCWQQSTGMISVAGNSSSIRLWDVGREQCVRVFHTGSSTCIGSLSCCADTKTFISEPTMESDYIDCQSWTRLLAVNISTYIFSYSRCKRVRVIFYNTRDLEMDQ